MLSDPCQRRSCWSYYMLNLEIVCCLEEWFQLTVCPAPVVSSQGYIQIMLSTALQFIRTNEPSMALNGRHHQALPIKHCSAKYSRSYQGYCFGRNGCISCHSSRHRRDLFVASVSSHNDRNNVYFLKKWRRMSLSLLYCFVIEYHISLEPAGETFYIYSERSHLVSGIYFKPISYGQGNRITLPR